MLLDRIIQQSPIGIAVIGHDGRFRTVNPAYCGLFGYRAAEMLNHRFTMVFAPAERERMLALHQAFLDHGGELKGEWQVLRRDGTVLSTVSESVRVTGDDGQGCRLVYVIDITERKQIELALKSSQQFLQSVLDGLTAHVCVLDESGRIMAVNRAWRDFAAGNGGRFVDAQEGVSYLDACDRAIGNGNGDAQASEALDFARCLREVLAGQRQHFQLEYACHAPHQQRWFMAQVSRIEASDPPRVVVTHDDVTALKQTQDTLRRSETLLLDPAASIPGAMFRLANQGHGQWRFVYMSPGIRDLFELTPEQACDDTRSLRSLVIAEDRPGHDASIQHAMATQSTWEHEYRIRTASGMLKWIHAKSSLKRDAIGAEVWTGVLTDVSERKRMEAGIQASEETYRTLFETVPQGVVYQDAQGRIISANPAALRILGLTLEQMQGRSSIDPHWHAVREDGSDFPGEEHPAMQALRTGQPVKDVVMGVSVPNQGRAWILISATPIYKNGQLTQVYASFEDITQRTLLSNELRHQASTDFLTGVANRRTLMHRLHSEFERVRRHPALQCSVLALDLDEFKHVNDTWGHAAGDAVLVEVARRMRETTRPHDLVGRSGGEEFMLLPDTGADDAAALAERVRDRIALEPVQCGDLRISVTVSIGHSVIDKADADVDAVLARADHALYHAKTGGRNQVCVEQAPDWLSRPRPGSNRSDQSA